MIKLLIETENYINQYHIHDIDFIHRLGFRAIIQMRDIENCLTFHPESRLSKKDIISYSKKYLDTPIVKKYISQSWITDCYSIKSLFRYIIIKYRLFNIYYLYIKHIKRRCIQNSFVEIFFANFQLFTIRMLSKINIISFIFIRFRIY